MRPRQPSREAALGGIIDRLTSNISTGVFRCRVRMRGNRAAPALQISKMTKSVMRANVARYNRRGPHGCIPDSRPRKIRSREGQNRRLQFSKRGCSSCPASPAKNQPTPGRIPCHPPSPQFDRGQRPGREQGCSTSPGSPPRDEPTKWRSRPRIARVARRPQARQRRAAQPAAGPPSSSPWQFRQTAQPRQTKIQ